MEEWNELSPPPDYEERQRRAPLPSRHRGGGMDVDFDAARRNVESAVRRNPLRSAAIALAAGFMMGRLIA